VPCEREGEKERERERERERDAAASVESDLIRGRRQEQNELHDVESGGRGGRCSGGKTLGKEGRRNGRNYELLLLFLLSGHSVNEGS
jgi:hypothetical protein